MPYTPIDINNVNSKLKDFIEEIICLNKTSVTGNTFDEVIYKILYEHLNKLKTPKFKKITEAVWTSDYKKYKEQSLTGCFEFGGLSNSVQDDCLIVDKPNGSQQWPDILIIFNKIGLPIEVKSTAKGDKIVWNSGLPISNKIYIYGSYTKGVTTFLGNHVISDNEYKTLKEMDELSKTARVPGNKALKSLNSLWDYYPRPMFNSSEKYFKDKDTQKKRENDVIKLIESLDWTKSV